MSFRIIFTGLAVLFIGLACVKIETGPETGEQSRETSELRARDFRVNWANRFSASSPFKKAVLLKDLIDSVSVQYIRYGYRVVDEWQQGNTGRGTVIADSEMREVVTRWNEDEQPVIEAYEEVMEYSLNEIKRTNHFDSGVIQLLEQNIEHFYKINSGVFLPSGTVDDYEFRLEELRVEQEDLSSRLAEKLVKYRNS